MTKEEFLKGYLLWIVQPWGKRYHLDSQEGQLQSELYYRHLSYADAETWLITADLFAQGKGWPALEEIKPALRANVPKRPALPAPERQAEEMPPEVRERIHAYLNRAAKAIPDGPTPFKVLRQIDADCQAVPGKSAAGCPRCKQPDPELVVCWCRRDFCRACVGRHIESCEAANAVRAI